MDVLAISWTPVYIRFYGWDTPHTAVPRCAKFGSASTHQHVAQLLLQRLRCCGCWSTTLLCGTPTVTSLGPSNIFIYRICITHKVAYYEDFRAKLVIAPIAADRLAQVPLLQFLVQLVQQTRNKSKWWNWGIWLPYLGSSPARCIG